MNLIQLKFRPGMVRDMTEYAGTGCWYDCNWVRFRMGLPEKMGGWAKKLADQFLGICRSLTSWSLLNGLPYLGLGTNLKFYVTDGTSYVDVTPIRLVAALGANPLSVTNGSANMIVHDVANGAVMNDFVTLSGATAFAGLTTGNLNKEFEIVQIIDGDHYSVTLDAMANATTSGGGAGVTATYQINTGAATAAAGLGWGAGTWGHDTWGSSATDGPTLQLRIWSVDNFGEDLVAAVRNGGIYYWDATTPSTRMVTLASLAGASNAPVVATAVLVSPEENHVIAFGVNPLGSGTQDPLFVRWSDTQSATNWTPVITNTAGGYRLSAGTQIIAVAHTRGQILIWTDIALYTMTWIGAPLVFNFQLAGYNVSIIGPNASINANDVMFWMGQDQFYMYDGRITPMDCPITDYVFTRLSSTQGYKTYAFSNSLFDEIGWLYASTSGSPPECDSYVIYNYKEKAWYFGTLDRTAWIDLGGLALPAATSEFGYLYSHEFGFDDGSTNPPSGINTFITSSPLEGQEEGAGEHYIFIDRLIPDITFRNTTASTATVTMTVAARDYPGTQTSRSPAISPVTGTASGGISPSTITEFTEQCFIRLRGRSATFTCQSTQAGMTWRLGVPRLNYRVDGRR